jgi:hypothetical protein
MADFTELAAVTLVVTVAFVAAGLAFALGSRSPPDDDDDPHCYA